MGPGYTFFVFFETSSIQCKDTKNELQLFLQNPKVLKWNDEMWLCVECQRPADFCILVTSADHFSECVEGHAFETYDKFIKAQGGVLRVLMLININLAWLHAHT